MKVFFWDGENTDYLLHHLPCDIVQFRFGWTKEKRQKADELIKAWNLTVFSYPPKEKIGDKWRFVAGNQYVDIKLDADPEMRMSFSPKDWTEVIYGRL